MQESTAAENARRRLRTLNPLVLAVLLEAGMERSTVENARRRQRTLYPLFSSEARKGAVGTVGCRERSTETENALPPFLAKSSSCLRKRSRLGIADTADQERSWPASEVKFYSQIGLFIPQKLCARGFPVPLGCVRDRVLRSGNAVSRSARSAFGTLRSFSRAVLMSKNILGAPRRNVLRAGRSSDPRLGTMLDIDLGCIVTTCKI